MPTFLINCHKFTVLHVFKRENKILVLNSAKDTVSTVAGEIIQTQKTTILHSRDKISARD